MLLPLCKLLPYEWHCTESGADVQQVAQLEAETQQIFQENQQLNKQSSALNHDVCLPYSAHLQKCRSSPCPYCMNMHLSLMLNNPKKP